MMGLLAQASIAINGSKFKAVNNRDKNFTRAKMDRRMAQIEERSLAISSRSTPPTGRAVRSTQDQDEAPQCSAGWTSIRRGCVSAARLLSIRSAR
jgi:hypothetical protein